jgi:hypothetical protein
MAMSIVRATCGLVLIAACNTGPQLGGVGVSNPADPLSDFSCGAGLVANDVGWTVEFACSADPNPPTLHCSDLDGTNTSDLNGNGPNNALTIVLTTAAAATTGTVAITSGAQTSDVASATITSGGWAGCGAGTAFVSGSVDLTTVERSVTADFMGSDSTGFCTESGSITAAPYCP